MAHFNFVISQNAKWGHAGFYIDWHRMTSIKNQKSKYAYRKIFFYKKSIDHYGIVTIVNSCPLTRWPSFSGNKRSYDTARGPSAIAEPFLCWRNTPISAQDKVHLRYDKTSDN